MKSRVVVISIDGFAAFYWTDPQARLPRLRRLAERGAVASGMETVFPSTTWPSHVSMVTGVSPRTHGVVANHVLNRGTRVTEDLTGDPIYDAPALLRAPTVYDLAHASGLRTAAIDWPATRNATTLDFNLPFFKDQRVFETQTARAVWEEHGAPKYLGTHGQRPLYGDNAAFFLAAGAGIGRDVALGAIKSRDVAPTVATVLGFRMDAVEGAVLSRMLA